MLQWWADVQPSVAAASEACCMMILLLGWGICASTCPRPLNSRRQRQAVGGLPAAYAGPAQTPVGEGARIRLPLTDQRLLRQGTALPSSVPPSLSGRHEPVQQGDPPLLLSVSQSDNREVAALKCTAGFV